MFVRYIVAFFVAILSVLTVSGQSSDELYYPYSGWRDDYVPPVETDSSLFYRAIQSSGDIYEDITDYGFSFASTKRRGQDFSSRHLSVDGVVLPSRYMATIRTLGTERSSVAGIKSGHCFVATSGGVCEYMSGRNIPLSSHYAAIGFTDRNYTASVKLSVSEPLGHEWSLTAMFDARTGPDMSIEGVFTNALTLGLSATKRFSDRHDLSFMLIVPPSARGLRSASTAEAFALRGDNLYNPSWGMQDGKVRNSRVRRDFIPFGAVKYRFTATSSTSLDLSFGFNAGTRRLSGLGWYDATTPAPDNYRKMPSYYPDGSLMHAVLEEAWRSGDVRYTQIDWGGMYEVNRISGVHYAVEDRVERITDLQLSAFGQTVVDDRLMVGYGFRVRHSSSRYYKQMRDLLGGDFIKDMDYYLVDDDTFGNKLQNDMRNPDREVRSGDRFGYDYALTALDIAASASVRYSVDRYKIDVAAEIDSRTVWRTGYYEKELFPGDKSYGRSSSVRFSPYAVKAAFGWSASPRHYVEAVLATCGEAPYSGDIFLQPQYNNRMADGVRLLVSYAAELNYAYSGHNTDVRISLFASSSYGGMETMRYFDDLASCYCDMVVAGIDRMYYGIEAAAGIRISRRWRAGLAMSAARYKYSSNPVVTVYADADNHIVDAGSESYMGGCTIGGAPQILARATINYFGSKGWGFETAASYAGSRYVDPVFLRRTARVATQAGIIPEIFDQFVIQERLGDAFSLDAAVFKTFRFRLSIMLSVRNILGNCNTVYDGYEPLRIKRARSGVEDVWTPFDTRYTYSSPRSFYISVSYKF